ncbi:hypothetical protein PHMEG_00035847, partial [Phytophthora megakarya]
KYLHILREFTAPADSLATEALGSKTSKVELNENGKHELAGLNRIREVIYDSSQTRIEVKPVAEDSTRSISPISASHSDTIRMTTENRYRPRLRAKSLNLKTVLRGNSDKLKYRAARDAWKIAERFLLTDDNVMYYMNSTPRNQQDNQEESRLRLVVPTTMIQEVLQNNHDSWEGGHQGVVRTYQRVRQDYYWYMLTLRNT